MIIRSQDKRKIIPLNQPVYIETVANEWAISTERYFLGTYSTEEKAIKVLDMIQNKYFEHMTLEQNGTIMGILEKPKVFQMPSDEDVEV